MASSKAHIEAIPSRSEDAVRAWMSALIGGAVLGTAYALSPLTVWFFATVAGLFAWLGRGLTDGERRWVFGILAIAISLRLLAVAFLFATTPHHGAVSFFWDGDGVYLKRRAVSISNIWRGVPIAPQDFTNAFDRGYGWTTYLYVLAYVQYLVGVSPYGVHLFNIAIFLATAVLLYRLTRTAYGAAPALLGLAVLLFLPTPFFWSVSALKESLYVFIAVVALVAAVTVVRGSSIVRRVTALAVLAGALEAISGVRAGGRLIVGLGLAAGLSASVVVRRASLVVVALACLVLGGVYALGHSGVQARVMSQLKTSAVMHLGNVRTEGHSYRLLDQNSYSEEAVPENMTSGEGARFIVRAFASFVLVPLPWQVASASERVFLAQQVVWYLFVICALVGLIAGLRRDPLVTSLLAGFAATGGAVIALNSGNIGTMVRHRDTIVPFLVWLSALGAVSIVSTFVSRSEVKRECL